MFVYSWFKKNEWTQMSGFIKYFENGGREKLQR